MIENRVESPRNGQHATSEDACKTFRSSNSPRHDPCVSYEAASEGSVGLPLWYAFPLFTRQFP